MSCVVAGLVPTAVLVKGSATPRLMGRTPVFQAAGFSPEELVVVPDTRVLERSVEDVVAWVLSTSSTAPHLFGDRLDDFIRDLRGVLLDVSPEGRFSMALSDNRLRFRTPR